MGRKLSEPEVLDAKGSLDDRKEGNEEASDNRIGWDWKTAKTAVVFWHSRSLSLQGGAGGKKGEAQTRSRWQEWTPSQEQMGASGHAAIPSNASKCKTVT